MKRKKLLFVTDVFPYPLDRGQRVRVSHLLEACAKKFAVTLVAPRISADAMARVPACVSEAVLFDANGQGGVDLRLVHKAMGMGIGLPIGRNLPQRIQILRALKGLDLAQFDLIWAERPHVALLFHDQRSRTLVDFDDIEHLKLMRSKQLQKPFLDRLSGWYKFRLYRRAELFAFQHYLRIVVCSEDDESYLSRQGAGRVLVAPNGVAVPPVLAARPAREAGTPLRLVFLGNMTHEPNIDAVRFFADHVLPLTRGTVDGLDVIGPNASQELIQQYSGRVRFRGFVDDLAIALSQYDAMVAPIRFGSGTKLKVLDAMANGLPLVSTPCGAEGLRIADNVHVLVASTAEEFAAALARLDQSCELAVRLRQSAYALAQEQFSWDAINDTLSDRLEGIAHSLE